MVIQSWNHGIILWRPRCGHWDKCRRSDFIMHCLHCHRKDALIPKIPSRIQPELTNYHPAHKSQLFATKTSKPASSNRKSMVVLPERINLRMAVLLGEHQIHQPSLRTMPDESRTDTTSHKIDEPQNGSHASGRQPPYLHKCQLCCHRPP